MHEARALTLGVALLLSGCSTFDNREEQAAARHETESAVAENAVALKLARVARQAGDHASAVNLFKAAVTAAPNDAAIAVELGEAQLETGAVDDAIATFEKIDPASSARLGATLGLARAQLMLRAPARALAYADAAVALAPRDKRAQIGRGVALDMLGRHRDAQICYRTAMAIDPHDVAARSDLALSLAFTGGFDEAIAILTPLARAPSATARIRQNLALVYGLKGDAAAARTLSRADLTAQQAEANLKFFAAVRSGAR